MICVTVNNKQEEWPEGTTVQQLLDGKQKRRAVVWINGKQLLLAEYEHYVLKESDHIKILRIVAGG